MWDLDTLVSLNDLAVDLSQRHRPPATAVWELALRPERRLPVDFATRHPADGTPPNGVGPGSLTTP